MNSIKRLYLAPGSHCPRRLWTLWSKAFLDEVRHQAAITVVGWQNITAVVRNALHCALSHPSTARRTTLNIEQHTHTHTHTTFLRHDHVVQPFHNNLPTYIPTCFNDRFPDESQLAVPPFGFPLHTLEIVHGYSLILSVTGTLYWDWACTSVSSFH